MELRGTLTTIGSLPVLEVSGEIDLATLPLLRDHLARAVDAHRGAVLYVDVEGVSALDDTGLGMLLGAAGRARESGGDLVLVCTGERLRRRFELTGLDRAVVVRDGLPR